MNELGITLGFSVVYKDGREERFDEVSFDQLQTKHFGSREKLREEVQEIVWKEKSTLSRYISETDEVRRTISDGDVNPYGWRMKHR